MYPKPRRLFKGLPSPPLPVYLPFPLTFPCWARSRCRETWQLETSRAMSSLQNPSWGFRGARTWENRGPLTKDRLAVVFLFASPAHSFSSLLSAISYHTPFLFGWVRYLYPHAQLSLFSVRLYMCRYIPGNRHRAFKPVSVL